MFDFGIEMPPQEYLVKNLSKVSAFIDKEIGVDYEVNTDEYSPTGSGSITVFELYMDEHKAIREYISKNSLWLE